MFARICRCGSSELALIAILALSAAPRAASAQQTPDEDLALIVSGGISLGAYQAGVTHVISTAIRRRANTPVPEPLDRLGTTRLRASVGASAGNINAVLAALTECHHDQRELTPLANYYYDTWINIGWDKLSPADDDPHRYFERFAGELGSARFREIAAELVATPPIKPDETTIYTGEDGLVTRRAFTAVERYLARSIDSEPHVACRLPVGMTVTRVKPVFLKIAGDEGTSVGVQRYVVALDVSGAPGPLPLAITNYRFAQIPRELGKILVLPSIDPLGTGMIDTSTVIQLVKAASAFPIAFAPLELNFCTEDPGDEGQPHPARCATDAKWARARFVDGGFFDNMPIGVAIDLMNDLPAKANRTTYIYVDPVLRRNAPRFAHAPGKQPGAVESAISMTNDAVREARQYELQGIARYRHTELGLDAFGRPIPGHSTLFQTSSRYYPLIGDRSIAFGAFFHRNFRIHDYVIGLYDGIYLTAELIMRRSAKNLSREKYLEEFARTFGELARSLLVTDWVDEHGDLRELRQTTTERRGDLPASTRELIYRLFRDELGESMSAAAAASFCRWVEEKEKAAHADVHAVACRTKMGDLAQASAFWAIQSVLREESLEDRRRARRGEPEGPEIPFEELLARLPPRALQRGDGARPPEEFGIEEDWRYLTLDRLLRRAQIVEREDRAIPELEEEDAFASLNAGRAISLSRLILASTVERRDTGFQLDRSSIARLSASSALLTRIVLPYSLSWEQISRSGRIGWLGTKLTTGTFYLGATPQLAYYARDKQFRWRGSAGLGIDPAGRTIDDLELNAVVEWSDLDLTRTPRSMGLELALTFGTKLRFAFGFDKFFFSPEQRWIFKPRGDQGPRWDSVYFELGLADVSGVLFWLVQSVSGAKP